MSLHSFVRPGLRWRLKNCCSTGSMLESCSLTASPCLDLQKNHQAALQSCAICKASRSFGIYRTPFERQSHTESQRILSPRNIEQHVVLLFHVWSPTSDKKPATVRKLTSGTDCISWVPGIWSNNVLICTLSSFNCWFISTCCKLNVGRIPPF